MANSFFVRHKKEILWGAVWTLGPYFVTTIFPILGKKVVNFFLMINHKYSDFFYRSLSHYDKSTTEGFAAALLLAIVSSGFFLMALTMLVLNNRIKSLRKQQHLSPTEREVIGRRRMRFKTYLYKFMPINFIIGLCVLYSFSVLLVASHFSKVDSTVSRFERNLKLLRPYTDLRKLEQLESKWVQLKTKSDYMIIYDALDSISSANKIKLLPKD